MCPYLGESITGGFTEHTNKQAHYVNSKEIEENVPLSLSDEVVGSWGTS